MNYMFVTIDDDGICTAYNCSDIGRKCLFRKSSIEEVKSFYTTNGGYPVIRKIDEGFEKDKIEDVYLSGGYWRLYTLDEGNWEMKI